MGWNDGSSACCSYYITTTGNSTDVSNHLYYIPPIYGTVYLSQPYITTTEYIYAPTEIKEEPKVEKKVVKEENLKRTVTLD